jgi:hypothetical protein
MSSGVFSDNIYVADNGVAFTIRTQVETAAAWNPNGTGAPVAGNPSAQVSKGKRSIGVNARMARFKWSGTPPAAYKQDGIIALPILTQAAYTALVKNTNYAYLGGTLNLVGKTPEFIR